MLSGHRGKNLKLKSYDPARMHILGSAKENVLRLVFDAIKIDELSITKIKS